MEGSFQQSTSQLISNTDSFSPEIPQPTKNSSIHNYFVSSINISYSGITQLPQIKTSTSRLLATNNKISKIELLLPLLKLKYIDLSNNLIQTLDCSNKQVPFLETLKVNNNRITKLIRIESVRYYYAINNPIDIIQSVVCNNSLLILSFDWIFYISGNKKAIDSEEITVKVSKILNETTRQSQHITLIQFLNLFESNKLFSNKLVEFTHNAIINHHQSVFDYLQQYFSNIGNIQQLKYQNRSLFEYAVQHQSNKALQYFFKTGITNKRISDLSHIHIACRYNNQKIFKKLLSLQFSINVTDSKDNTLLHQLIANFDSSSTPPLLLQVLRGHYNPNQLNKRQLNPLLYAVNSSVFNLIKFIEYIENNKHLVFLFDFNQVCGYNYSQNILHFAVRLLNTRLVQLIIRNELVNPFILNSMNKRPRQLPTLTTIKKMMTKYENTILNKLFNSKHKIRKIIKSNKFIQTQQTMDSCEIQLSQKSNVFWQQFLMSSNKQQRTLLMLKVVQKISSLNVSKQIINEILRNQCLNNCTHQKIVMQQKLQQQLKHFDQISEFQQYNIFQNILSSQIITNPMRISQSISSKVKFSMKNKHQQLIKVKQPRILRVHQSIIGAKTQRQWVQIKGGRKISCLQI